MALQTRSWLDGRRKTTALVAPLLVAACGWGAKPETPPAAEQAPLPSPRRVRGDQITLQLDRVPGDVKTFSFVLIPGIHAPPSVDELWRLAREDRGARLKIGHDAEVTFDRVDPGPVTACAVAKATRDRAIGYDCRPVETSTVTLSPVK